MTLLSVEGIKCRFNRPSTKSQEQDDRIGDNTDEYHDKSIAKAVVKSLEVNVVNDLPIASGVRYDVLNDVVYFCIAQF